MDNETSFPIDILKQGLKTLHVSCSSHQLQMCQLFFEEYSKYSRQINISNIKDPQEFVVKHILDSLSIFPFLEGYKNIADLGSGGGFPGIVLGIFFPDISITLIEVIQKKVDYLKHLIQTLSLSHVQVFNASKEKVPGRFDLIVTRAVGSLQKILLYAKPYLSSETEILAYKGRLESLNQEIKILKEKSFQIKVFPISVPYLQAQRHLVFLTRHKKN